MQAEGRSLARDVLRDLAAVQNGLITRQQALEDLGLSAGAIDNLVSRGSLVRVAHGIYRYPHLPGIAHEPFQVALLRTGDPEAALSHETALLVLEISDVNPARYHVTIPRPRRIRREDNDRFVVHVQRLGPRQVRWWEEMRVVTAATAIEQCITLGTPTYLLRQAMERGQRTGLVRTADADRLGAILEARHDH
ncbi:type IV toxin-antitoxin system AbiEi family antitoxin domain-containing protein [Promicromonospora sp. NFX87]|uniref:type IV toxin-antitoxin system AbiEi family antitoxin domain-containing protein n=1 Tax=Promicromonospora sp. NFX87 TaxID=3402691 RepID=UPI003AFA4BC4